MTSFIETTYFIILKCYLFLVYLHKSSICTITGPDNEKFI